MKAQRGRACAAARRYIVMSSAAVFLTYAPPWLAAEISRARGMCITAPAYMNQLLTDNSEALVHLENANQDVTELRSVLDELEVVAAAISSGCGLFEDFFTEIFVVFLPCILSVITIVYALCINQTLCCAAGCCSAPPTKKEPAKDVEFNTMSGIQP